MIVDFDKEIIKLNKVRTGEIREAQKLGHPMLDEHFRFKKSSFDIFIGHANVGKTTTVLYLMLLQTLKHKTKWLVFSSENEPHSLIRKLIEFKLGMPINKIEEHIMLEQSGFINDHFKFIFSNDLYTYKELLSLAKHVKNAWHYDGFMIDPYNSLKMDRNVLKGINSHEYHYEVASEFRIFCKENEISIWLNMHCVTEALRRKHKESHYYAGHPQPPMMSDVEGGGKFGNRADNFYCIHRYTQHESDWMLSMVHTRKIKDTDTGARPTNLDKPIRLKSIINNVGFEIEGVNLIKPSKIHQSEVPF